MPNKTIPNNFLIVILLAAVSVVAGACHRSVVEGGQPPAFERESSPFQDARVVGRVESGEIRESSGITASKCQENVLWTHNDSGDGPFIFAMDSAGRDLGKWRVDNAENVDWEDIASFKNTAGECTLYIGDTGNGNKNPRGEHKIYRVAEPAISNPGPLRSGNEPGRTMPAEFMVFAYPDERQDSETLLVHPATGDVYVVTKQRNKPAGVYKLGLTFGPQVLQAERVGDLTVPAIPNGFLTGGDISPDGTRVIICDYFAAYEFTLPADAKNFDDIWRTKPVVIGLGDRNQGEAIGYSADGTSLFATSEGKHQPLIQLKMLQ